MKILRKILVICTILTGLNLANSVVLAQQNHRIEIDGQTLNFQNRVIEFGDVKVLVSYGNYHNVSSEEGNLSYNIYYNDQLKLTGKIFTDIMGSVYLENFDNDHIPEVIVNTFTGGAHCCTNNIVYTWKHNQFHKIDLGLRDGSGGKFEDLNRDGNMEFVTVDDAFLYTFSSYAGSFPPTMIFSFNGNNFDNVTTQYRNLLRRTLNEMYQSYLDNVNVGNWEVNGILAGYVAQKTLLGEYKQGWEFMLNHYDHNSDWGLDIYNDNGDVIGHYSDFPTALKAFLFKQGYTK